MRNNHYWDDEDYKRDHEIKEFERLQKEGDPIKFLKHYLDEISFEYFMESIQIVDYFAAGGKDYIHNDYSIKTDKISIYTSDTSVMLNAKDIRLVYEAGRLSGYNDHSTCSYEYLDYQITYNKFTKIIEIINDLSLGEFGKDDYDYAQLSKLDNIITHLHGVSSFEAFTSGDGVPGIALGYDGSWDIMYSTSMNMDGCFLHGKNKIITGTVYHQNTFFDIKNWMYLQKHPELNGFL